MIPTTTTTTTTLSTTLLKSWPHTTPILEGLLEIDVKPKTKCHGTADSTNARCRNPISEANRVKIIKSLREIVDAGSFSAAQDILGEMAQLIMCQRRHQKDGPGRLSLWKDIFKRFDAAAIKKEDEQDTPSSGKGTAKVSVYTAITLKQEVIPKKETPGSVITFHHKPQSSPSTPTKASPKCTPVKRSEPVASESKHEFEDFGLPRTIECINKKIKELLLRPLSREEMKQGGQIYTYTFPESYHDAYPHIKIGYAKDVKERMAQWRVQCAYTPELLGQFSSEHYVKVEKLVHAQLWNERKREKGCPTCRVWHQEWFKVHSMTVSKYIGLWTSWMRQTPYDDQGILQDKWQLRIESFDMTDPKCWELLATGVFDQEDDEDDSEFAEEDDSFAWSSDDQFAFSEEDVLEGFVTDESDLFSTDEEDDEKFPEYEE
ncbi:hypothetical protein FHETE_10760 [Fusarium heterosporum]|uniref:Bacteriophage T5 Orf172 DNA-binding domain-containing protein n=1 Tax=Fusarium heterosporum TaxID=42747 RepID=A0A8H5SND3_FUSHE|nr:hypothetical protein FHETE_10760 [Fusarium heterosporum]